MDPSVVLVRPASTVIAFRKESGAPEVLMVRRGESADFLGGAYVFPGGAVDDVDHSDVATRAVRFDGNPAERPWRAAALRELAEEAGILITDPPLAAGDTRGSGVYETVIRAGSVLLADGLEYLSNWVTPVGAPRRYDTRFFVTILPDAARAMSDDVEVFDATFVDPGEALGRADEGEWYVEFPTRRHLELLAGFSTAADVIDHARSTTPARVEPRLVVGTDGSWRVLLPGDRGFDEAPT